MSCERGSSQKQPQQRARSRTEFFRRLAPFTDRRDWISAQFVARPSRLRVAVAAPERDCARGQSQRRAACQRAGKTSTWPALRRLVCDTAALGRPATLFGVPQGSMGSITTLDNLPPLLTLPGQQREIELVTTVRCLKQLLDQHHFEFEEPLGSRCRTAFHSMTTRFCAGSFRESWRHPPKSNLFFCLTSLGTNPAVVAKPFA